MKYKVLKDFPTADGVLYEGEVVKQWDAFTTSKNLRVKDTMGRIWNVPKKLLQRTENEKNK
jgi:hypothetical protein